MKILIIGAGAMGCRFAANFQKGGAEVVLCDIWKEHVDAINRRGLQIIEEDGSSELVKMSAVEDVSEAGGVDVVMIFTKSIHTEDAVGSAMKIMKADTPVVSVQNGLGNLETIKKYIGEERVIVGCTKTATSLEGPGVIRVEGFAETDIMALGDAARCASVEIRDILEAGGMPCHISNNIMVEIWDKLAFNCAMNPITAVTRLMPGHIGGYGIELFNLVLQEAAAVAAAEGISVNIEKWGDVICHIVGPDGERHLTSMLQDVLKVRPTEIDAICGSVIKKADLHGISVPHLKTLYNLVKIIDASYANQILTPSSMF
jgi:2-dehydropantoate 2-reductase